MRMNNDNCQSKWSVKWGAQMMMMRMGVCGDITGNRRERERERAIYLDLSPRKSVYSFGSCPSVGKFSLPLVASGIFDVFKYPVLNGLLFFHNNS